jgi:hypothetical protein
MEWSWFTSLFEEMESVSWQEQLGGMVLPYTFPEKQTFGFDAQQTGHQMWKKMGRWMVPKNSPKLAVDLKSGSVRGV